MRFVDFLKATVLLSAAAATLLAALTIITLTRDLEPTAVYVAAGWWLASARATKSLPELRPGMTIANRLWPLLASTFTAGVVGFFAPQVAAVAAGFAIIWALAWRRQEQAVAAIEERDAVRFYVDKTSPLSPIQLVRTPGFGGSFLADGAR